jgi:protein-histidine pros-kinase
LTPGSLFQSLLEGAPDAIVCVNRDGNITLVNSEAEAMFGYRREELIGRPVEELVPEGLRAPHVAQRERYATAPVRRPMAAGRNLTGRKKNGVEFPVEISLSPVETPEGILVVSVVRDVTARKAAEQRELTMLRALATIGESAAILAHEIKNPITAVNAALKTVAARLGVDDRDVLEDLVQRMRRLETMIRRTLSFVKPLQLHRKACHVAELFEHAVGDARPALAHKRISIRCDVPADLEADADPQLVREVLANAVTNAAEAFEAEGTIVLRARRGVPDGVVLSVEDDGPGLPPSMRGRPIQPFVTSKPAGCGLGLTICRKIVEEHGGTLEIDFVEPHGTRFTVTLPGPRPRGR